MAKPHITRQDGKWVVRYPYVDWVSRFHAREYAFAAARAWDMRESELANFLAGQRHILFA